MRSIAGVGMTPPNVLETPKPWSSVMISRTFGAPLGGTTRGAHHGVESAALCLITPPNFGGGGGSCFPSRLVVALGEPGTPVIFRSFMLLSLRSRCGRASGAYSALWLLQAHHHIS